MSGTKGRAVGACIVLTAVLTLVGLTTNARWAGADEGWRYNAPELGGCVIVCIPIPPPFELHCPCYEEPPIIIEG